MPTKPWGPSPCDVLFVGEAPGKEEDALGIPFVGASGKEFRRMLEQAGFEPGRGPLYLNQEMRMTNVFHQRPKDNNLDEFCAKRGEVGKDYRLPPLSQGKYVRPEFLHHLEALKEEIERTNPRLIVALGNTAAWALIQRTGISKLRGSTFPNELVPGAAPVLPIVHPAAIMRDWSLRVVALGDLLRVRRFLDEGFKQVRRELWLEPTIDEVEEFCDRFILDNPPAFLSFDIETFKETITCIGFAPRPDLAITIPFFDPLKPDRNYWATAEDEVRAWMAVRRVLLSDIPKLGQNGLYDIQYLYAYRIPVRRYHHDTMIRHHSLHPELEKGLGFMATLYTDEAPWKVLRDRNKDNYKIDDE